jgi:pilus assembly protein Flp/PilA
MHFLVKLVRDTRAATAIEYGLIAALIAIAAIASFNAVGSKLSTTFNNIPKHMKAT